VVAAVAHDPRGHRRRRYCQVIVTSVALRDLVRRPAALVRGPKLLWAPLLFVQPVGSPLYLIAGRRAAAA